MPPRTRRFTGAADPHRDPLAVDLSENEGEDEDDSDGDERETKSLLQPDEEGEDDDDEDDEDGEDDGEEEEGEDESEGEDEDDEDEEDGEGEGEGKEEDEDKDEMVAGRIPVLESSGGGLQGADFAEASVTDSYSRLWRKIRAPATFLQSSRARHTLSKEEEERRNQFQQALISETSLSGGAAGLAPSTLAHDAGFDNFLSEVLELYYNHATTKRTVSSAQTKNTMCKKDTALLEKHLQIARDAVDQRSLPPGMLAQAIAVKARFVNPTKLLEHQSGGGGAGGGAGDGDGAGGGAGGGTGACLVFRIGFVGEVCRQPSLELGTLNESTRTAGDLKLYITAWASNLALLLASVCSVAQEAAALEETTAQVQLLFTVTCCRADAEQAIPAAFDTALNNAKRTLRCWNLSFPKVTIEAAEFVIYPSRAVSMCASYLRHFDRSTEHLKLEVLTRGDLLLTCKQCDLTAFVRRCVTEGYLGVPFKIGGDVQKFVFIEEECCLCDTFWVLPKGVLQPFVQYLKDPGRTCPQRCKCSRGWRPGGHAIPGGNVHYVSRHPDIKGKIATFLEEPVCSPNTAVIANGFYELLGRPVAQGAFE